MKNERYNIPGLYNRNLVVTLDNLNQHRKLSLCFQSALLQSKIDGATDDLTYDLIMSLDPICRIPCVCLSLLGLRWSDLTNLNLEILSKNNFISVIQSKTSRTKRIDNTYIYRELKDSHPDPNIPIIVCTYEHVRKDIRNKRRFTRIRIPKDCMDETHIFRHLTASWMNHQAFPISAISKKLGHINKESTLKYIHNWEEIQTGKFIH